MQFLTDGRIWPAGFTAIAGAIAPDAVRSAAWRSAPTAHVLTITHYGDDSVSLIDTANGAVPG